LDIEAVADDPNSRKTELQSLKRLMARGGGMPDIEQIARLRPEERDAILDAMIGMCYADNHVQDEELLCVRRYAAHLADKDIESIVKEYKPDLQRVGRKIAQSDLGPTGRAVLVRGMALVAAASGDLDEKEVAFYSQCLRAFGIPASQQKQIEHVMARHMYGDLCRVALLKDGSYDRARKDLDSARQKLSLSDEETRDLEKHARIEHTLDLEADKQDHS